MQSHHINLKSNLDLNPWNPSNPGFMSWNMGLRCKVGIIRVILNALNARIVAKISENFVWANSKEVTISGHKKGFFL